MTRRAGLRTVGYTDRLEAGRQLADELASYASRADLIVLGLPRGGVVTAAAVAERLGATLDVFCVRKLGVPWQPELAMGAVATGGVRVINEEVVHQLQVHPDEIDRVVQRERNVLEHRERLYRGDRPPLLLRDKTVIVVDDGMATGASARAALAAVRTHEPARLILAVPVAPTQTVHELSHLVNELVCPLTPVPFEAVGRWYRDFRPTTDAEVRALLSANPAVPDRDQATRSTDRDSKEDDAG
ncbi:MAG TPA: phosphoribosyltransferase [Actinopolymorphaceae bacterium]|jgi:putative phosphoribosyl transferase